jgi:hypothetical protein
LQATVLALAPSIFSALRPGANHIQLHHLLYLMNNIQFRNLWVRGPVVIIFEDGIKRQGSNPKRNICFNLNISALLLLISSMSVNEVSLTQGAWLATSPDAGGLASELFSFTQ